MSKALQDPEVQKRVRGLGFEPVTDKVIRYGLGAVKGTGQQAIEAIVRARDEGGPFKSFYDFCVRMDRSRINKRTSHITVLVAPRPNGKTKGGAR